MPRQAISSSFWSLLRGWVWVCTVSVSALVPLILEMLPCIRRQRRFRRKVSTVLVFARRCTFGWRPVLVTIIPALISVCQKSVPQLCQEGVSYLCGDDLGLLCAPIIIGLVK